MMRFLPKDDLVGWKFTQICQLELSRCGLSQHPVRHSSKRTKLDDVRLSYYPSNYKEASTPLPVDPSKMSKVYMTDYRAMVHELEHRKRQSGPQQAPHSLHVPTEVCRPNEQGQYDESLWNMFGYF